MVQLPVLCGDFVCSGSGTSAKAGDWHGQEISVAVHFLSDLGMHGWAEPACCAVISFVVGQDVQFLADQGLSLFRVSLFRPCEPGY